MTATGKTKVIPQIRELLTNYGEIGMLWFDMWIHHSTDLRYKRTASST